MEVFKAVKIYPVSKVIPTNRSTTKTFEGCGLCDIIRGLSIGMSTGKPSFFPLTVLPDYRGHFFNILNAFVFSCRMGTVGDVKLKVCIHVDKSFLIVCV